MSLADESNHGLMAVWMPMAPPMAIATRWSASASGRATAAVTVEITPSAVVALTISPARFSTLAPMFDSVWPATLNVLRGGAPSTVGCGSISGPALKAAPIAFSGVVTTLATADTTWPAFAAVDKDGACVVAGPPVSMSPAAADVDGVDVDGAGAVAFMCLAKNSGTSLPFFIRSCSACAPSARPEATSSLSWAASGTLTVATDCRTPITAPMTPPAVADTPRPKPTCPATPSGVVPSAAARAAVTASNATCPSVTLLSLLMLVISACWTFTDARSWSPDPGSSVFMSFTTWSGTTALSSIGANCRGIRLITGATTVWPSRLPVAPAVDPMNSCVTVDTTMDFSDGGPDGAAPGAAALLSKTAPDCGRPCSARATASPAARPALRPTPKAIDVPATPTRMIEVASGCRRSIHCAEPWPYLMAS